MNKKKFDELLDEKMTIMCEALSCLFDDGIVITDLEADVDEDEGTYKIKIEAERNEIPFCDEDCDNCPYEDEDEIVDGNFLYVPTIDHIVFNPPATIVFWDNGTKTVVKCREGDTYSKYAGFSAAVMKKLFGSTRDAMEAMEMLDETPDEKPEPDKKTDSVKHNSDLDERILKAITLSAIVDGALKSLKELTEEVKKDGASAK